MNGSRNPAASPTSSQSGPARRATRAAERAGASDGVRDQPLAPRLGIARDARDRGAGRARRWPRRRLGEPVAPAAARQHDADVDPAARHGREAAVRAAGQDDHARGPQRIAAGWPARRRASSSPYGASATCHDGPTRSASHGLRTTPAAATSDRGPSAPTTTRATTRSGSAAAPSGASTPGLGRVAVVGELRRRARDRPVNTVAPAAAARSSSAGSSADRSNPTARSPPASAPYASSKAVPAGVSTRIAGIWRATRGDDVGRETQVAQLRDGGRRREHAAGAPAPRRGPLGDEHPVPGPGDPCGDRRAGDPAPDDQHVNLAGGSRQRPAPAGIRTAAIATRWPANAPASATGRRPAAASSARSSTFVYARRTESGPSWRVYRLRVVSGQQDPCAQPVEPGPDQVVDDDAVTREPGRLDEEPRSPPAGSRWWTRSDAWTTSNDRSAQGSDRPSPTTSSRPGVVAEARVEVARGGQHLARASRRPSRGAGARATARRRARGPAGCPRRPSRRRAACAGLTGRRAARRWPGARRRCRPAGG